MRLYVLVNGKLTKSQRIPQACHAVAEFIYHNTDILDVDTWVHKDRTLVVLKSNQDEMIKLQDMLSEFESSKFYDEDLGNMLTSICFEPMPSILGQRYFSHLQLA